MPLYWLVYRHNNQISVVIEPEASSAIAWPLAARAQQAGRMRRIGVLTALDGGRSRKSGTYRNPASRHPHP
jgi:hypothetical protein